MPPTTITIHHAIFTTVTYKANPETGHTMSRSCLGALQGGRAGPGSAGSRQLATTGQGPGGAGGILIGQYRLAIQGATLSDTPVVQVGRPQGGPHQADGAQGSLHPGQTVEVGLRWSGRQRSQISPYQAGSSEMEGKSDKFG